MLSYAAKLVSRKVHKKGLLLVTVPERLQNRVQSCGVIKVPACISEVVDEKPAGLCRCGAATYMYTLNICMLRNTKAAVLPAMSAQSRQSPCEEGAHKVRPTSVMEACMQQATASSSGWSATTSEGFSPAPGASLHRQRGPQHFEALI